MAYFPWRAPPLSGTGQFQTLGGYILSQSLEEGTLKKASHNEGSWCMATLDYD